VYEQSLLTSVLSQLESVCIGNNDDNYDDHDKDTYRQSKL